MRHRGTVEYDGTCAKYRITLDPPFKDDKYTVSLDKDTSFKITDKTTHSFIIAFPNSKVKRKYLNSISWYAGHTDVIVTIVLCETPWQCFIEFNADDVVYSVEPPDRHSGEVEFSRWVKRIVKRPKNTHKVEKSVNTEYSRDEARDYFKSLLNRGWKKV
jgi:hypothetical protein